MDLSRLKWPLIIIVVAGGIWLLTDGGVRFLRNHFNQGEVGADPKKDEYNEAGLSKLAGFLMLTFRYASAEQVLLDAMEKYPEGVHFLHNKYRLAKCVEKQGRYDECVEILVELRNMDAHQYDDQVPEPDILQTRIDKLIETHELGEVGSV
ncbi:MAG: hypothetical protein IT367_11325 [Candidatus Hydrogenedentes bacterium]|nr:hypothetical protein [Candidatus Hydrogenedentota bacterium]